MSFRRTLTAVLVLFLCLAGTVFSADDKMMQLRVNLDDPTAVRALRLMGFEGMVVTDQYADVFTDGQGLARIRDAGLDVTIIHDDVAAYYAEMLAEYDGMGGYRTLSEINAYIDNLIAAHPDLVSNKVSIGLSIEGRDLWAVKISDNPGIDEDEPEIFFNALTHANEPATAEALIYFMDFLTDNYSTDPQATYIVDNREVWFVLVVNPDGYYYNEVTYPDGGGTWRKNRRPLPRDLYGVDLNRNWGYMWAYDDDGSSPKYRDGNYRGEAPFSEPETQALRDFILAHDFEMIVDYHAPGYSFLWPWSYNMSYTPDQDIFQLLADTMRAGSLYQPDGQAVLANGCSGDWHYGEQTIKEKIMTFCVETADGTMWPDPANLPAIVAELLPINILLCRFADSVFLADSVYMMAPPNRPVVHAPEGPQGPEYDVTWAHDDTYNPAVQYELMEYQSPQKFTDYADNLDAWVASDHFNQYRVTTFEYYSAPSSFVGFASCGESLTLKDPVQVADGDVFTFMTMYELSKGYEYVYVQVSTDGENFVSLPGNITTDENPWGYNQGNGITGMKTKWTEAQFDLSAYVGQSIWIRFIGYAYKDWGRIYLDDLHPIMQFQTETVIASDLTDTLYGFTDKPDGEYYYRVRAKDAQDQWGEPSTYGIVNVGGTDAFSEKVMQLRVSLTDPTELWKLRQIGFDHLVLTDRHADVFTDESGLARIRKAGLEVEIIHDDVAAYYAEMLAEYDGMGGYRTLAEINTYIDDLIAAHPDLVSSKVSIGQSIEGRDLWAVKISDNPGIDEDEPEVFFNALIHANEPVSAEALIYFMDFLTDNYGTDPEATNIVDNREVWFVLVVNPDGYYYNEVTYPDGGGTWRKNRRPLEHNAYGVDLNRNFSYMWAYDDDGSSPKPRDGHYRGEAPFSEPETQALRDFILAHDFDMIADYHAPGRGFLWPWSYDQSHTPDEDIFQLLADTIIAGTIYTADGQPVLANGCSDDWHYGEQTIKDKILAYCVETANGNLWPDPDSIPDIVAGLLPMNLLLCRFADSVFLADSIHILMPPERPVVHAPEGMQGPEYTVSWQHDDLLNPASSFELVELQGSEMVLDSANTIDNWIAGEYEFFVSAYQYYSPPSAIRGFIQNGEILALEAPILVGEGEVLTFWALYELSKGYDYVYVQVSTDGENFVSLPGNITTDENPYGYNLGNGITGMKTHWTEAQFDLSAYEGQSIWLRFIGYANRDYGVFTIDDIYPVMKFQTETVIASDLTDTLYNFTDKPDGEYFYRVRARDAEDQWGELSAYGVVNVGSTDAYAGRAGVGDANGDGVVNQGDVVYLIDYLYKGGPAPTPMAAGDANGDGTIDQKDCMYLIDYLHRR